MHTNTQGEDFQGLKQDIQTIVGGNFSPHALGPDAHDAIVARVRSHAAEYLDVFESMFLGTNFDAVMQSNLHLPSFLSMVADVEPERARNLARQLLKQLDSVLVILDGVENKEALLQALPLETMNLARRLEQRRQELKALLI